MTTKLTGTVTLLFSDIEDSTSRLADLGSATYLHLTGKTQNPFPL
jgi:hypothetical protein